MWWWFIYERLAPLFIRCESPQGYHYPYQIEIHKMANLPDGSQRLISIEPLFLTFTYCPTTTMHILMILSAIGLVACLCLFVTVVIQLTSPLVSQFLSQPEQPTQLAFEEIMQQLDKAAKEYLEQAK